MGTPEFALPSLRKLLEGKVKVIAVITAPDRPKGRGKKLTLPPVKTMATSYKIPCFQPPKVNDSCLISQLKTLNPDLIVVVAFGQLLSPSILRLPPLGCINLHPSLLPKYRGSAPINWAIINGERSTGITTLLMDEGMDTGRILLQKGIEIEKEDTSLTLSHKLAGLGADLLEDTLSQWASGMIKPIPQDDSQASYAPPLRKEDGRINWGNSSERILNLIRGLDPWPSAFTHLEGKILKIFKAKEIKEEPKGPGGKILEVSGEGIKIATGNGALLITKLQLEGHKQMKAEEFLRGYRSLPSILT